MNKGTWALIGSLVGLDFLFFFTGPVPQLGPGYPWAILAIGVVCAVVGRGLAFLVRVVKRRLRTGEQKERGRSMALRGAVCIATVVLIEVLLARFVAPFLSPFWVSESLHYAVIIIGSVLLVLWARVGPQYAVLAPVLSICGIALVEYLSYGLALDFTTALGDFLTLFHIWPFDTAVALSAWWLTAATVE